ncbi:protein CASPARIAN STRIP INTEGRITY FACTOR 1-like [Cornus florida]|uniref:protein CASPARIAN STRIP INTEGRITY FACTOR 1-like n=1 Tax=Cornus florida TaxID=4283 RepID=UPI00289E3DA2|nr:protein CASPARIAN STRIP INTEGRITY FACTOR 1-like [Cornus florida]
MGLLLLKKIGLLFLLISASLLSTSLAGRQSKFVSKLANEMGEAHEEKASEEQLNHEEMITTIHERLLRVNTKDYGKYDPAPALVKPPFKLIPN